MRKIRVFELARAKNIPISQAVDLLAAKGVPNATATTYVDAGLLADMQDGPLPAVPPSAPPPAADDAELRAAALAQRLLRRDQGGDAAAVRRDGGSGSMAALTAITVSIVTLVLTAFVFLNERDDRAELRQLAASVAEMKSSSTKVEEIVVNNRAQIMEMRDQLSGMEKRLYDFKRGSLLAQIKSQGVVVRALSENLKEPLKGKAVTLADHLSQF